MNSPTDIASKVSSFDLASSKPALAKILALDHLHLCPKIQICMEKCENWNPKISITYIGQFIDPKTSHTFANFNVYVKWQGKVSFMPSATSIALLI
jgi:hypothetical protein